MPKTPNIPLGLKGLNTDIPSQSLSLDYFDKGNNIRSINGTLSPVPLFLDQDRTDNNGNFIDSSPIGKKSRFQLSTESRANGNTPKGILAAAQFTPAGSDFLNYIAFCVHQDSNALRVKAFNEQNNQVVQVPVSDFTMTLNAAKSLVKGETITQGSVTAKVRYSTTNSTTVRIFEISGGSFTTGSGNITGSISGALNTFPTTVVDNGAAVTLGYFPGYGADMFVFNECLIFNTGKNKPLYLAAQGENFAVIDNWPANVTIGSNTEALMTPKIAQFGGRLVALGLFGRNTSSQNIGDYNERASIIFSSPITTIGSLQGIEWTVASTNSTVDDVVTESPGKVVDGGQLGDNFIVYKSDMVLSYREITSSPYILGRVIQSDDGIFNCRCFADLGNNRHIVMGNSGIYIHNGENQKQNVSKNKVQKQLYADINYNFKERCFVFRHEKDKETWFCIPTKNAHTFDTNYGHGGCDKAYCYAEETDTWYTRDLNNFSNIFMTEINGVTEILGISALSPYFQRLYDEKQKGLAFSKEGFIEFNNKTLDDTSLVKTVTAAYPISKSKFDITIKGVDNLNEESFLTYTLNHNAFANGPALGQMQAPALPGQPATITYVNSAPTTMIAFPPSSIPGEFTSISGECVEFKSGDPDNFPSIPNSGTNANKATLNQLFNYNDTNNKLRWHTDVTTLVEMKTKLAGKKVYINNLQIGSLQTGKAVTINYNNDYTQGSGDELINEAQQLTYTFPSTITIGSVEHTSINAGGNSTTTNSSNNRYIEIDLPSKYNHGTATTRIATPAVAYQQDWVQQIFRVGVNAHINTVTYTAPFDLETGDTYSPIVSGQSAGFHPHDSSSSSGENSLALIKEGASSSTFSVNQVLRTFPSQYNYANAWVVVDDDYNSINRSSSSENAGGSNSDKIKDYLNSGHMVTDANFTFDNNAGDWNLKPVGRKLIFRLRGAPTGYAAFYNKDFYGITVHSSGGSYGFQGFVIDQCPVLRYEVNGLTYKGVSYTEIVTAPFARYDSSGNITFPQGQSVETSMYFTKINSISLKLYKHDNVWTPLDYASNTSYTWDVYVTSSGSSLINQFSYIAISLSTDCISTRKNVDLSNSTFGGSLPSEGESLDVINPNSSGYYPTGSGNLRRGHNKFEFLEPSISTYLPRRFVPDEGTNQRDYKLDFKETGRYFNMRIDLPGNYDDVDKNLDFEISGISFDVKPRGRR